MDQMPKEYYIQRNVFEVGVLSAVINFNYGNCGILNVFKNVGIDAGYFTIKFCPRKEESRIQRKNKNDNEQSKMQRKKLRAIRKNYIYKNKEKKTFFMKLVHLKKQ